MAEITYSELSGHRDLGVGPLLIPFIVAGTSATAAVVINQWLDSGWDVGTYNAIVKKIDDTLHSWNDQGWVNNCWGKNPQARKDFLAFWSEWSAHYKEYGKQSVVLLDSAEMPVRTIFLPALDQWAVSLNKMCGIANTGPFAPIPPPEDANDRFVSIAKWSAVALVAIIALKVYSDRR